MATGPFNLIDINRDEALGDKIQFGVSGTTMPDLRKSPINALFVLDKHVGTLPRDLGHDSKLVNKIHDKVDGSPSVKAKRGGTRSSAPIDEQAVIVRFGKESLPVQDPQLHMVAETIERHYNNLGVGVKTIILDSE